MTVATGHVAQSLQRLAALVTQRRAALGWSQEKVAEAASIAPMTYRRIEEAKRAQAGSYAKLEGALGFRPGACLAVLGGARTVTLMDGTELTEVMYAAVPPEDLEKEIRQAVQNAMVAGTGLTADTIREINEKAIAFLRERGVLPGVARD